jgi:hypothetical protein
VEFKEHSQVKISNTFAALKNLDDDDDDDDHVDINRPWDSFKEIMNYSHKGSMLL